MGQKLQTCESCLGLVFLVAFGAACAAVDVDRGEPDGSGGRQDGSGDADGVVRFEPVVSPTTADLTAVWVGPGDELWIVGTGLTMRRRAEAWEDRSLGLEGEVAELWVSGEGRRVAGSRGGIFAAVPDGPWQTLLDMRSYCFRPVRTHLSDDGVIHAACPYYDGLLRLSLDRPAEAELFSNASTSIKNLVWPSGAADVTAIGRFQADIVRYRGGPWLEEASWSAEEVPPAELPDELLGLWGPEGDTLVAVGRGGVILRRVDGVWGREASGTAADLTSVWGTPQDGLFAVGGGGVALFDDGRGWRPLETGTTADLLAVRGVSGGDVVAVGADGTILRLAR